MLRFVFLIFLAVIVFYGSSLIGVLIAGEWMARRGTYDGNCGRYPDC